MNTAAIISNIYLPKYVAAMGKGGESKTEQSALSFQAQMQKAMQKDAPARSECAARTTPKKEYPSAVEEWKKSNPKSAGMVDGQVRSGKKVLRRNGVEDVDRDSMTMEEYKQFFTALMDSIPYDPSQQRDVNVWTITEQGWEQMKNDPDYEAWVLGYTAQDRSFYNQWASLPGYAPHYHTERFGATFDEHLGQSFPMEGPSDENADDEESWWSRRHRIMLELLEEQQEKAARLDAGQDTGAWKSVAE